MPTIEEWSKRLRIKVDEASEFPAKPSISIDTREAADLLAKIEQNVLSIKKLQTWHSTAWNRGFMQGCQQNRSVELDLARKLKEEREGRLEDNAAFTEEILRLESRIEELYERWINK